MNPINRILKAPLLVWHWVLAPMLPPMCRFHPSCSVYAMEALDHYSLPRALWLTTRRLARCHPFHPGGFDPLPLDSAPEDEPDSPPKEPSRPD